MPVDSIKFPVTGSGYDYGREKPRIHSWEYVNNNPSYNVIPLLPEYLDESLKLMKNIF